MKAHALLPTGAIRRATSQRDKEIRLHSVLSRWFIGANFGS